DRSVASRNESTSRAGRNSSGEGARRREAAGGGRHKKERGSMKGEQFRGGACFCGFLRFFNAQDARWPYRQDACVTNRRDRAAMRQLFRLRKFPSLSRELPGNGVDNRR